MAIAKVSFYSELYLRGTVISVLYYSTWNFWPCTNENKTVKGALNCPADSLSCAEDLKLEISDLVIFTSVASKREKKKIAQIFQLLHPYHNRKQFQCLKIVLNNKTGPFFLECNWSMRRHVLAFLEDSKSRDIWQYKHVVRLPITLYKGVLTFWVLLMKF